MWLCGSLFSVSLSPSPSLSLSLCLFLLFLPSSFSLCQVQNRISGDFGTLLLPSRCVVSLEGMEKKTWGSLMGDGVCMQGFAGVLIVVHGGCACVIAASGGWYEKAP